MSRMRMDCRVKLANTKVTPSVIAQAAPSLVALAALEAPVGGDASFDLDARLALRDARVSLQAGAGQVRIGGSEVPVLDGALVASGTPDSLTVEALRVSLPGHDSGSTTHLEARGTLLRRIVGADAMQVNSSHHQAVRDPGPHAVVNAVSPDRVIEGIEDTRHRFCLGVQWHPEFFIDPGDRRIFDALIAACRL